MESSPKKSIASRRNAQKSTGPRSSVGKRRSSRNAVFHGLRSEELLLDGESQSEFAALLEALRDEFSPHGPYESHLVERMAVGMWRSRRLMRAEKAEIQLSRSHDVVKKRLLVDYGYIVRTSPGELPELAKTQAGVKTQLAATLAELEALFTRKDWPGHDELVASYPYVHQWLEVDAKDAKSNFLIYCGLDANGALRHLPRLAKELRTAIKSSLKRIEDLMDEADAVDLATVGQLVPLRADLFARYQSALDNQVERAFRQLMQAKALRGATIETESA